MQKIKGKNTNPEIYLRKLLFAEGFRYRICTNRIIGHPDIWLPKYNTAIFINGCFWHQHQGCKRATIPETRKEFWLEKFSKNKARDEFVRNELLNSRIKCLVVWECTVLMMEKDKAYEMLIINKIIKFIEGDRMHLEL